MVEFALTGQLEQRLKQRLGHVSRIRCEHAARGRQGGPQLSAVLVQSQHAQHRDPARPVLHRPPVAVGAAARCEKAYAELQKTRSNLKLGKGPSQPGYMSDARLSAGFRTMHSGPEPVPAQRITQILITGEQKPKRIVS